MEACSECGFDLEGFALGGVPGTLRQLAAEFAEALAAAETTAEVRQRPTPDAWSPLEHACHVRDLLRVQRDRLQLALEVDLPTLAPMRQEARAIEERYNEQDPAQVAERLLVAAEKLVTAVERLEADDWERPVLVGWVEPPDRTVAWLARSSVHGLQHHLNEVAPDAGRGPR